MSLTSFCKRKNQEDTTLIQYVNICVHLIHPGRRSLKSSTWMQLDFYFSRLPSNAAPRLPGALPSGEPRVSNRWSGRVALSHAPLCYWTIRYNGNRNDEERRVYGGGQQSGYIEDLRKRRGENSDQTEQSPGMLAISSAFSFAAPSLCAAQPYSFILARYHPQCSP